MKHIIAAAATQTGRRKNNQDNFMLSGMYAELAHDAFAYRAEHDSDRPFLAVLCDGMGGESSGEVASYIGCKTLSAACGALTEDFSANKQIVTKAVLAANDRLCELIRNGETGRMGSTVVAALIQNDFLYYTNLGDSRMYLLRSGKLIQMTKDHTEGQMMVDAGVLTPEQLLTHPSRNKLNRHLGIPREEMHLECPVYRDVALLPGDRILIASDGVFGALSVPEITVILSGSAAVEEKAAQLVDLAYRNGSKDNMTAFVIEIENARTAAPAPCAASPFRDTAPAVRREAQSCPSPAKPQAKNGRSGITAAVWIVIGLAVILLALILVLACTKCSGKREAAPETEPTETPKTVTTAAPAPEESTQPETPEKPEGTDDKAESTQPETPEKPEGTDDKAESTQPETPEKPEGTDDKAESTLPETPEEPDETGSGPSAPDFVPGE